MTEENVIGGREGRAGGGNDVGMLEKSVTNLPSFPSGCTEKL